MLELNPRSDDFVLTIPNNLIPPEVYKVFDSELLSRFNTTHDSIMGYIKESLQTVTIPDASMESLEQITHHSTRKTPAMANRIGDVTDTKLSLEFRSSNAMANYLICYYAFFLRKFKPAYNTFVGDMILVLNDPSYGFRYRMIFEKCDWTSITGVSLSYNAADIEYKTFSLDFSFNWMSMDFEFTGPGGTLLTSKDEC